MFAQASSDVAAREEEVAAEKMNARRNLVEVQAFGCALRLFQVGKGTDKIIGQALYRGASEPRACPLAIIGREG